LKIIKKEKIILHVKLLGKLKIRLGNQNKLVRKKKNK